ncbi:hypothetical protein SAMN04488502_1244 [Dendrosporobacter quercicolus]|uniref:Uncharacterized protein n=1 Tax=Dendrosporobacter quercicolus TaxID=146817 RepID=A0A1H0AVJ0_9FIRM|nr:S-layer protein [Dendrosporobacter quercicolus]SDN37497.1 hypothetical protein SAMN04488502_1244 [Dendrosporobacter quercicolus]
MRKIFIVALVMSIATGAATASQPGNPGEGYAADPAVTADNPGYIAPWLYTALIDELMAVGQAGRQVDHKLKVDGEVRYHYSSNNGFWRQDASGLRVYLALNGAIDRNWRVYGRLEGKKKLLNYSNDVELSRLYAVGKLGRSTIQAGSFGYLMAEGNIYDSGFDGIRADYSGPLHYTLSYGKTNASANTAVAALRLEDFDYELEAGIYHYQAAGGWKNTIKTLGANYNFSNFGVGAMVLDSVRKDVKGNGSGYVAALNYGDLKSWRPGTYKIFAKYYNQPQYTYLAHGMNGAGGRMQGFKGYGLGLNHTVVENLVAGIEYYDLADKVTGRRGQTWWGQLTHYF